MNVCNLEKGDLDKQDMTVKNVLWRGRFHGRQPSDDRLYSKRNKEVYFETKLRVVYYVAGATNEWIRVAWRN